MTRRHNTLPGCQSKAWRIAMKRHANLRGRFPGWHAIQGNLIQAHAQRVGLGAAGHDRDVEEVARARESVVERGLQQVHADRRRRTAAGRDDGADECTSGFTVRKNGTSVDGVLTAAHCSGLNQYREPTGLVYSMSYQAAANPGWGDVEWHTTTHTEYDDFYYSKLHNSRIDVTGMLQSWQFDYGDIVCAFGRVSGAMGCDTINGLWYSGSGYSYLVSTTPCGTVPGDSGGPRYLNGTAIGIGRGFFKSDGSCTLSSLAYTLPDLGLTLKS